MNLPFSDLLAMAAKQPQPQRLLFVFTTKDVRLGQEAQDDADFTIIPQMYTDKTLDQIDAFDTLRKETDEADLQWDMVFVSGLSGKNGDLPSLALTDERLDMMVSAIQQGVIDPFAIYDRDGHPVILSKS